MKAQTRTGPDGTTTYHYGVEGQLLSVDLPDGTKIEYVIDSSGRRIGKKVNGALVQGFVYLNFLNPIAELDGAGNVVARFVHGHKDGAPAYIIKGGNTYRVIADHLSSPRLVIDTATGAVVQRIDYDEYGNVLSDTNPGFIPFGFGAGLYDQQTKLPRFGARDYDSFTGRWTAKDPAGFNYGEFNVYAYVENEPVNRVDPTGLFTLDNTSDCCGKEGEIRGQIKKECERVNKIDNSSIGNSNHGSTQASCLKKRCANAIIICSRAHGGGCQGANGGASPGKFNSGKICTGHVGMGKVGRTAIHEWAHECGWPGAGDPNGDHSKIKSMAGQLAGFSGEDDFKSHEDAPWNSEPLPNGERICPSCTRPDLH